MFDLKRVTRRPQLIGHIPGSLVRWVVLAGICGCQTPQMKLPEASVREYSDRMMVWSDDEKALAELPEAGEKTVVQAVGNIKAPTIPIGQTIQEHLGDPEPQRERVRQILSTVKGVKEKKLYENYLIRLEAVSRPRVVRLTLADAIRRMLANNYAIRVAGYQPAIDAARVVEAEAAFDSVFFFNFTNDKQDRPSSTPQLSGSSSEARRFETGVRKLLSVGTQVSVSYQWLRTMTNIPFQTINPAYTQVVSTSVRQPLLRGFGLDFNRNQINIRKNDRRISHQQFRRQIRDQLQAVEDAYWLLVQARRLVTIQAELIAYTQDLYDTYEARLGFDVFPAQVSQIRATLDSRKADFVRVLNSVYDAEDELKRRMNDPELDLSTHIELIPEEVPTYEPFVVDRLSQLQAALDNRSELKEAKLTVENARISVGVAKNQVLPRFDVIFSVNGTGLDVSSDQAFGQMRHFNFLDYLVQVEFEVPIGNRGPRAQLRQARLAYAQSATAVRQLIEDIVAEVNTAIRRLHSNFDQLTPRVSSVESARDFLSSIRAREVAKNTEQINSELSAQSGLAAERQNLLQALVDYNRAITNLERTKGTLLRYNNVVLERAFESPPPQ